VKLFPWLLFCYQVSCPDFKEHRFQPGIFLRDKISNDIANQQAFIGY